MIVVYICLVVLPIAALLWYWIRRTNYAFPDLYSPPSLLFTGIPKEHFTLPPDERYRQWVERAKEKGLCRYRDMQGKELIGVFREDLVKEILVTKCPIFLRTNVLKDLFPEIGNGIFSSCGADHAWQRKLMAPILSPQSVKNYTSKIDHHATTLCQVWKDKCFNGSGEVFIESDFPRLALDIVGSVSFGYKFNSVVNSDSKLANSFHRLVNGRLNQITATLKSYIPFYDFLPLKSNRDNQEAIEVTKRVIEKMVKHKREEFDEGTGEKSAQDLLGAMLIAQDESTGRGMSDKLLMDNMFTLLLASYDTTSSALCWLFYRLAVHQDKQEKAREEALRVVGSDRSICAEHVDRLHYITCVVKESLRMIPGASDVYRYCKSDCQLGEYKIPKGTELSVMILGLQRSRDNWIEPDTFWPERFLDAENPKSAGIRGRTYLPFSIGPRGCIGQHLAMMELKVILARVLLTFRFWVDEQYKAIGCHEVFSLKPSNLPALNLSVIQ